MNIEVRRCASSDETGLSTRIYNETWPDAAVTLEEAQAFHERMDDSEELIAFVGDEPAGSAITGIGGFVGPSTVFTLITVLPAKRCRGAGTALYQAISSWSHARERATLRTRAREDDPDGLGYATRHGFAEVGRETDLTLELTTLEPPSIEPPAGVEIASLADRPDAERHVYDIAVETYPDIPDSEDYTFGDPSEWLRHHLHGPHQLAEANFVAFAGDEAIGYAKLNLSPARPGTAVHGMTAVRRAWRGRGIAGALKRAQIRWAIANGVERFETSNEARNEPMQRVNLALGYRPTSGTITLEGPLAT
ncbi:MAG: GNAT family N-acetyltransferase [Thermoleophilia bacterium]